MDTIPNVGSYLLIFRAFMHNVTYLPDETRHRATKLAPIDACDGSPSTCRLDVELIPEPSWRMPMDTIPNVGSRLLIFRAFMHNVTYLPDEARRRA